MICTVYIRNFKINFIRNFIELKKKSTLNLRSNNKRKLCIILFKNLKYMYETLFFIYDISHEYKIKLYIVIIHFVQNMQFYMCLMLINQ
jgi:hypothetical protein